MGKAFVLATTPSNSATKVQRTLHDPNGKNFRYQKNPNPNEEDRWEWYFYNDSRVWLYQDTTLPAGDGPAGATAYQVEPSNGMALPRNWGAGEETRFNVTIRYYNHRANPCPNLPGGMPWPDGRHKLRFAGTVNLGAPLGQQEIIIIDRYHDVGVNRWNPRGAARFWYAKGLGWIRWEAWPDSARDGNSNPLSNDGKLDRLEDPKWNSGTWADILATSPVSRIKMEYKTNPNIKPVPATCR
ncbi:hypothetical protein [Stigmatella aurantiaca]|uniref:Uncharacterized protein n=1 Tax=Stigmatella aurantiaca (strain DW4/3-1) TaxID=378806 RepID=E3FEL3_STIAD|nr:hypothetical protein [Stigmatella aurantiaca]ADO75169.1 uncharacterized protein STAUR_7413 [Stigmatella aurantiaca DW4/3-1]